MKPLIWITSFEKKGKIIRKKKHMVHNIVLLKHEKKTVW